MRVSNHVDYFIPGKFIAIFNFFSGLHISLWIWLFFVVVVVVVAISPADLKLQMFRGFFFNYRSL